MRSLKDFRDCFVFISTHGDNILVILYSKIKFHLDKDANIANYLKIGTKRK